MQSIVEKRGNVPFAKFSNERIYMRPFTKKNGLPSDISHWQATADAMLDGIETDGLIYIMVDQRKVEAGKTHRRPGLHLDGYWKPSIKAHGGAHSGRVDGWEGGGGNNWSHCDFSAPEGILLASNVVACRALIGEYQGVICNGGDCSSIDTSGMSEVLLDVNSVYAGNVSMLHESLPVSANCLRTVVRINIHGWTPTLN